MRPLPSPVPQLNGKRRALDFEPDPVDDDGDAKSDSPVSALDTDSLPSGVDNRKVTIRTDLPLARSPKTHLTPLLPLPILCLLIAERVPCRMCRS